MKRAFRRAYDRELALLKERASEFAADYPGIADRLGGLQEDNLDPAIGGLLEGAAFLAARVQLNIDEQFRTFTAELLEQVMPGALAPTPATMLAQARVAPGAAQLDEGLHFAPGEYLDARYVDADERISCRFRLAAPLSIWPLRIAALRYHDRAGPISALGRDAIRGAQAGLVVALERDDGGDIAALPIDRLPIHFTGAFGDAAALYAQILANRLRVSLRWLDDRGDPVFRTLPPEAVEQIGFDDEERLLPYDARLFRGFALLHEAFVLPRKILGMRIAGLREALRGVPGSQVELVVEFDRADDRLASRLEAAHLGLFCAPAVNLFEQSSSSVRLDDRRHEFVVTPDASPMTHYEFHALTDVWAHYAGRTDRARVHPLYTPAPGDADPRELLYFTTRRKPRRLTARERRFGGSRHRYRGTETFVSIYEPPDRDGAQRLQIRGLASNRHLPEHLPIGQGNEDFTLVNDQTVTLRCVAGPTPPRESLVDTDADGPHRARAGDNYWRLLSFLQLAQSGLADAREGDGARGLRELLSIFADLSNTVSEAQIDALRAVAARPVTRTIRRAGAYHPARGLEVRLEFDEDGFENSHVLVLGAVLDRFLADYASVNAFTQCVVATTGGGTVMTFPPRSGSGPLL